MLLSVISVSAQLRYKDGSFKGLNDNNQAAGAGGLGHHNMAARSTEWPADDDGETTTSALLIVKFEMLSPDEINKIIPSTDNTATHILKKEVKNIEGNLELHIFFVPSSASTAFQFNHETLGSTSMPAQQFKPQQIYTATLFNNGSIPVSITSEPSGARVFLDGRERGRTPLTIEKVSVGNHSLSLMPEDPKIANQVPEQTKFISQSNAAFNFDMYKRKNVTIEASPYNSEIYVYYNGKSIASGQGSVTIKDAPYDRKYDIEAKSGTDEVKDQLFINGDTPDTYMVHVKGSSSISFTAKQNNQEVAGAELLLNGQRIGSTPFTKVLEFGKYDVSASYGGYTGKKSFTVKKDTKDILIKIPNKKNVGYSPFDVDYRKRCWGIGVNYINRYYKYKVNGKSSKHNWVGEDGGSNGVQFGLTWQPYFGYGQGLNTGLYYQMTFARAELLEETGHVVEGAIYFPLQYQFRLPLHRNFSIAANAGVALTYGVSNKYSVELLSENESIDLGYGENTEYGLTFPDQFDYSLLIGFGLQFKAMQLDFKYSAGLKDHKVLYEPSEGDKISCKSGSLSLGLSLLF